MNRLRKTTFLAALLALVAGLGVALWWLYRSTQPVDVALYFYPFVGPEPLILNEPRYANPGGTGHFKVRDFQFFLSNIRLVGAATTYAEQDSYHLVRFDGAEPAFVIVLHGVPRQAYERVEFGIGVDAAANGSLTPRGDLDPNGRMAWTWEIGYKFVLFEGSLVRGDTSDPLVYHVGFAENYKVVANELYGEPFGQTFGEPFGGGTVRLDFRVDILSLFRGCATIDMAALSNVKFDQADAALLARNYAAMVTPADGNNAPYPCASL